MNKMLEDADKLIKQNEEFLKEFDKREEVTNKYFSFFEKDKTLDAKVKAFKSMPWNKEVELDAKLVDFFTKTDKEINKENLSDALSAINQINRINYNRNSTFPLTPQSIDKAISIQKGKQQENKPNIVQQPQPKEAMYKQYFQNVKVQPRPQSVPAQQNEENLEIQQESKPQKPNQSQVNKLNNSFTSTASTLNSSFTSTASLSNIQKQNTQKEVQTQSRLESLKSWFSEKFNKFTNLFSLKQEPEKPGNITNSINISTQKDNKFKAHAGQVVKNEKGNYR